MSYQLSDIRTKVQLRVRDAAYSTAEITNYLNDTLNDIYNEYRLPFMEATQTYTVTINDSDITHAVGLPTNYIVAIDLLNTYTGAEGVVPYRDIRDIDTLYPDADDLASHPAGNPLCWYFYGQTPRLFPKPDRAYTLILRYYKKPTMLSADADVPGIPSQFEELLVAGASYRVLQVKDNYDQAAIMENKYQELLSKFVMQSSQNQVGAPSVMRINRKQLGKTSF